MQARDVHSRFSEAGLRIFRNEASSTLMLADHDGLVLLKFNEVVTRHGLCTSRSIFTCELFAEAGHTVKEVKAPSVALMDYMLHRFGDIQQTVINCWSHFLWAYFGFYKFEDYLLIVDKEGTIIARFEEMNYRSFCGNLVVFNTELFGVDQGVLIGEKISSLSGASKYAFAELDKELVNTICRFTPFFTEIRNSYLSQECNPIPISVVQSVCSNPVDATKPTNPIELLHNRS